MNKTWHRLHAYLPPPLAVNMTERIRSACGVLLAVALIGLCSRLTLGTTTDLPMLIGPAGASALLLFAQPASPLAQPWSMVGGNVVSAIVGVACAQWIGDPVLAAALAVAGALLAMIALRCLHPPGGAVALLPVVGGPAIHAAGFHYVWAPIALNSLLLLALGLAFNNATRRRYPHRVQPDHSNAHQTADAPPGDRLGFTPADLDEVLRQYNQVLDISRDDLEELFLQTEMHAYRRRFGGIVCADIMSRDVVTAETGMPLEQASALLLRHDLQALPVLDSERRLAGIVTLADVARHAGFGVRRDLKTRLRSLVRRAASPGRAETVGQIMTQAVRTAQTGTQIVELVPLLSDAGLHQIPVVDDGQRLAGIITQSDLIAALYRGRLDSPPQAA